MKFALFIALVACHLGQPVDGSKVIVYDNERDFVPAYFVEGFVVSESHSPILGLKGTDETLVVGVTFGQCSASSRP